MDVNYKVIIEELKFIHSNPYYYISNYYNDLKNQVDFFELLLKNLIILKKILNIKI
jgi:hypothetical protein